MTYPLRDLVDNIYGVVSRLHISPSEVENLTTYEFDRYIYLMNKDIESDLEEKKTLMKSFGPLMTLFAGKR